MYLVRGLIALCLLSVAAIPATAQIELPRLVTVEDVPGAIQLRSDFGDGIGFGNGLATLDAFFPFVQFGNFVAFTDSRFTFLNDIDRRQLSFGLGSRTYVPAIDRILGLTFFYDNFDTGNATFEQISLAWEMLGDTFDLRGNLYLPENRVAGDAAPRLTSAFYRGNNLLLNVARGGPTALHGLDVEAGFLLPSPIETMELRTAAGYYHYEGGDLPAINGVRARLEVKVLETTSIFGMVQTDKVYGTSATIGVALTLGGPRQQDGAVPLLDRRAAPIERNPVTVVRDNSRSSQEVAIDAATNQPVILRHVNSRVAAGGDGTFESPVQNLTSLATGSGPRDILFVHAGSVIPVSASFALQNGQRLLGEGVPHFVNTTRGRIQLPPAAGGTTIPRLNLALAGGANAITLAQNNEVSGLRFQSVNATSGGIGAAMSASLGQFDINRNVFQNFIQPPISLTATSGRGMIDNNSFSTGGVPGVLVPQGMNRLELAVRNNTAQALTPVGVFTSPGAGTLGLAFTGNSGGMASAITQSLGGIIILENNFGNNTPPPTLGGTITQVPAGFFGFPAPSP